MTTVSVIVPAYNEEKLIAETLQRVRVAMRAFDQAGWSAELIVCDNASTDRTAALATAAGAKVVFEPIQQIARSRNAGARAATGDWLVFIDADSYPRHELLADVVNAVESGDVVAGGATITMDSPRLAVRGVVASWNLISRVTRWAAGAFIFCEAATFHRVNGFNDALYAAEELDLFRRLKREARRTQRRIVILSRYPLHSSARKAGLYSAWEMILFNLRLFLTAGRALRNPRATHMWYDGRR
jgi:glycosyltransferase involved in cell wall biosynthesis